MEKGILFMRYFPNMLSISRIILSIFLFIKFNIENEFDKVFIVMLIAIMFTDKLDGWFARKFNCISDFGRIIDPIADKIFCFSILMIFYSIKLIPLWGLVIMVSKDLLLIIYRCRKLKKGIVMSSFKLGKYKVAYNIIVYGIIIIILYGQKNLDVEVYQIIKVILLTTIL